MLNPSENFFIRFWNMLVQPHESVRELTEQRRALLTSAVALIITISLGIAISSIIARGGLAEQGTWLLLFTVGLIAVSYIISRTRYYAIASFVVPATLLIFGFVELPILIAEESIPEAFNYLNVLILLSLVIASGVLATELIALLVVGSTLAYMYLMFANNVPFSEVGAEFGIVMTIGVLTAVIHGYRARTERQNMAQIETANQELKEASIELEKKVEERTKELNRRSTLLEAAAYVSKQASGIQDLSTLLNETVNLITNRFGYYHAGIFLVDSSNRNVVLQAASSEGGRAMLTQGHSLEIGRQGIVGHAAYAKNARIAQDVGADSSYFNNPNLPDTHAEVALPLLSQNRLIGVLDIQSTDTNAFSGDDLYTLQTMADQIALAIENARLLNESREALQQSREYLAERTKVTWKQRLAQEAAMRATYTTLGFTETSREKGEPGHELRVPISLRGQKIGEVLLRRKKNAPSWDEKELEMAEKITAQVALALENARLLEESQVQTERALTISQISEQFSESLDIQTLLQKAVREIQQLPQISEASILMAPPEEKE